MRAAAVLLLALVLAGCGGSARSGHGEKPLLVVVNAPFSRTPYLGRTIEDGVRLASLMVWSDGPWFEVCEREQGGATNDALELLASGGVDHPGEGIARLVGGGGLHGSPPLPF